MISTEIYSDIGMMACKITTKVLSTMACQFTCIRASAHLHPTGTNEPKSDKGVHCWQIVTRGISLRWAVGGLKVNIICVDIKISILQRTVKIWCLCNPERLQLSHWSIDLNQPIPPNSIRAIKWRKPESQNSSVAQGDSVLTGPRYCSR
jgi:hypothetical protein